MKIDEYVPTAMPRMSASEKFSVVFGPKKYNAIKASIVVSEVLIDRAIVCDTLIPTISSKVFLFEELPNPKFFRFSRVRSNTTIVS